MFPFIANVSSIRAFNLLKYSPVKSEIADLGFLIKGGLCVKSVFQI
jgi:hypothetical protein